jgi:hypothetical protein
VIYPVLQTKSGVATTFVHDPHAPLSTIHSVNNLIVNGINRAGMNSATSIGLIGTGMEIIGVGTTIGTNQLQNHFFGPSDNGLK